MKKILIRINSNTLFFSYKHRQYIREDLMNTNIISDSELVFSDDYITNNIKIVAPFLKELCEINQITCLTFQNVFLASFLIELFKSCKNVKTIKIKKEENISYELCEKIIKMKNIKELDCYAIPSFMMEMLDKEKIKVTTHSEIFYVSPFMLKNDLTEYSRIFYKKEITIYSPMNDEDKEDFKTFLRINKYLKVVKFPQLCRQDLEYIMEVLNEYRCKNVNIKLFTDINTPEDIAYLKELNKTYKERNIEISLVYSDEYLSQNIIKQISINTLKICGIILFLIVFGSFGYVFVRNYFSMQEVSAIQNVVEEKIRESKNIPDPDIEEEIDESQLVVKNKYVASLLTINPDVVGYLKVNNTNVDYPVVQSKDNVYYLKKNLYQEDDINGWIYMDFRNSASILNENTIIYGHNMYYSGVMFGTLHRVLNSSWNSNPDNLVISFDTLYDTMKWQIFSIYTIPKTSDYLKVAFDDEEQKRTYIDMVSKRSIKNFNVEVNNEDKLLTLSTCTGDNARLVIHAKLISTT